MKISITWLVPCVLGLVLAGCTPQEDDPPPPPRPFTSLDAMKDPKTRGKAGRESNESPEELHVKQLAKLKEAQEKALKQYEQDLKKRKKQEERKKKDEPAAGLGKGPLVLPRGNAQVVQIEDPKHGEPAGTVRIVKTGAGTQTIQLPNPNQSKTHGESSSVSVGEPGGTVLLEGGLAAVAPEQPGKRGFFDRLFGKKKTSAPTIQAAPKGQTMTVVGDLDDKSPPSKPLKRSTAEMRSAMSAVDELQKRQPRAFTPGRPERHDTVSNQLQAAMAIKRLETESNAETQPSEKKAEVVDLGKSAKAAAPAGENAELVPLAATSDGNVPVPEDAAKGGEDDDTAAAAEETKAALEKEYRTGLGARDVVAREASFQYAAMERREDAIPYLLDELKQNNVLASFAAQCLGAIGRLTEEIEAALVRGVSSREGTVRQTCAQALGRLGSIRAVQPMVEGLKTEKSYPVRCAILDALGLIGERTALPALKGKLDQRDEIEFVKSHAALALARMGDPAGRAHLVNNLDSQVPAYQVTGLLGLAQLDDPQIAGHLNSALESGYDEVWTTAVYLFPRLGPARALPILRARLDSSSEVMRRRAALTMGFLGSDEAVPYIERAVRYGSLQERAMGCELLGRLARSDRIPLLIEKLQDPQTSVRQTAAVALTRLNAKSAVPALTEAARGAQHQGELPPSLRGAGPDPLERVVILSCVRILRGEKDDLIITTLPNKRDNTWPEVDRVLSEQQVELVKLYQFVDVIADHDRPLGVVLKAPDGKEVLYREGEAVASGFRVREIGLAVTIKDKPKSPPYVMLMRGEERITLVAGRPPEVEMKKTDGR